MSDDNRACDLLHAANILFAEIDELAAWYPEAAKRIRSAAGFLAAEAFKAENMASALRHRLRELESDVPGWRKPELSPAETCLAGVHDRSGYRLRLGNPGDPGFGRPAPGAEPSFGASSTRSAWPGQ